MSPPSGRSQGTKESAGNSQNDDGELQELCRKTEDWTLPHGMPPGLQRPDTFTLLIWYGFPLQTLSRVFHAPQPSPDTYRVVPNSQLVVARTAYKNNLSKCTINGHTSNFTEVQTLLKGRGIDLDHKRLLILRVIFPFLCSSLCRQCDTSVCRVKWSPLGN